jgi:hypothetical protein
VTPNQTSSQSIYIGHETKALADGDENEIVIGYEAVGAGSNTVVLGNNSVVETRLKGNVEIAKLATLGSESLNETNFATHADWDVTGDFTDSTGAAVYTHSAGSGTLTQTSGNLAVALKGNRWYCFEYDISAVTGTPTAVIPATVATVATSLRISNGTDKKVYFKTIAAVTDFIINGASATATHTFTLDNVSLKEVQGGDIHVGDQIQLGSHAAITGAATATMTNGPVAANPIGWMKILVDGTERCFPYWAIA